MKNLLVFFALLIFILANPDSGIAQGKRGRSQVKDTVIVYYCSYLPKDLNSGGTYSAAQRQINTLDTTKIVLIKMPPLFEERLTEENLAEVVEDLKQKGPNTRAIFHFFGHGKNDGDVIPSLVKPRNIKNGAPELLNIQKTVIQPLVGSNLGFLMVFVDACNSVSIVQTDEGKPLYDQSLSINEMRTLLAESKKSRKEEKKINARDPKFKGQPLGLMRSSKGYVAITSAGQEQKALFTEKAGGLGSLFFFNLLTTNDETQNSWKSFLDEFRVKLEGYQYKGRKQSPSWTGKIDGKPISENDLIFPYTPLDNNQVDTMLRMQQSDISVDTLKVLIRETMVEFCTWMDKTMEGSALPKELTEICYKPDRLPVYHDRNAVHNRTYNTGYVKLTNYRSRENSEKSLYILDSLKFDHLYRHEVWGEKLFAGYFAAKHVTGPKVDTIVRQRIFLEVQPEIKISKIRRFFRSLAFWKKEEPSDKAPLLISHVYNIPADTIRATTPIIPIIIPKPIVVEPIVPISPENFFSNQADSLLQTFYDLVEYASNHRKYGGNKDQALEKAKLLFLNPTKDTIEVSRYYDKKLIRLTPIQYFERYWAEFEGRYDSVHYYFESTWVPKPGTAGFVTPDGPGRWTAQVEYSQIFVGFDKGRTPYSDITKKVVTVWIVADPNAPDPKSPYRLMMGPVSVMETKPIKKSNRP